MTPQQIELALETIALVLEDLKKTQEKQQATITALEEALKEHAMQEVQRLGQEIEQGPCVHAKNPKGCYRVRCQLGDKCVDDEMSFRTTQPQRKPLTNGEIYTAYITATNQTLRATDERLAFAFARAIEAAHGIKE